MDGLVGLQAVQVSSVHHRMADGGGAWGIAVLAVGVALICYGTVPIVRTRRWRAGTFSAQGRVVDHMPRSASRRRETWLPLIEFEAEGVTVMFPGPDVGARRLPVGQAVDVRYDRANPHRAGLADPGLAIPWALILGFAVVGVFFAVVST